MILVLAVALAAFPQNDARRLVEQMDADRIEDRDKAERDLEALGKDAAPELRRAEATATGEYAIRLKRALRRALLADPLEEKLLATVDPARYPGRVVFGAGGHVATTLGNRVALGGVVGDEYDAIERFEFAPDGRTLAVVARRESNGYAVVGRRTLGPYGALGSAHLLPTFPIAFSLDGKRFAFRVTEEGKRFMIVDGKPQG